jgi:hypothetical protein
VGLLFGCDMVYYLPKGDQLTLQVAGY